MKRIICFAMLCMILTPCYSQEKYEEEMFPANLEPFCGYYIHVNHDYVNRSSMLPISNILEDVEIVKLSFDGHLIFEEISLVNGGTNSAELVSNEKYDLTEITQNSSYFLFETQKGFLSDPYISYYPDDSDSAYIRISRKRSKQPIVSDTDILVKNPEDVLPAIQSAFSANAQSKYTGRYVFNGYEIIRMQNADNPINDEEIAKKVINVTLHEDGYLYAEHITVNETFSLQDRFYITDKQTYITGSVGDGTMMSFDSSYEYENENTIVYNHSYARWSDDPEAEGEYLRYKIVYKKESAFFDGIEPLRFGGTDPVCPYYEIEGNKIVIMPFAASLPEEIESTYQCNVNNDIRYLNINAANNSPEIKAILLYNNDFGYVSIYDPIRAESGLLIRKGLSDEIKIGRHQVFENSHDVKIIASSFLTEGNTKYVGENLNMSIKSGPWVEGVHGDGIGEFIEFDYNESQLLNQINGIVISNGFVSVNNPGLYLKNNRIKKILVEGDNGIFANEYDILDTPNLQTIRFPSSVSKIKVTILDVYEGTTWDDTCINMIVGIKIP